MTHHRLDVYPLPKDKAPRYINEPWLIDASMLISQIEIYDQIWYVRHMPSEGEYSKEARDLVREFVERLEEIPDGGAEIFPFEIIEELKREYLMD